MGLFRYEFLGLNRPFYWGQIRPCEGSIWKTPVPFWNFKWPKQPPKILALLQMTPQNRANSAPCWAISKLNGLFCACSFLPLLAKTCNETKLNLQLSNTHLFGSCTYLFKLYNNQVNYSFEDSCGIPYMINCKICKLL